VSSRDPIGTHGARVGAIVVLASYAMITIAVVGAALNMRPFGLVMRDGRTVGLHDFVSHRGFACAVWSGDAATPADGSVYTLAAHLRATERWAGGLQRLALPFGYSPTMLWLLGPLCVVPVRAAFVVWTLAGLVCTVAVIVRTRAHWWTFVALLNPVTVYSIILGQTAVLSTAAFVYLWATTSAVGTAIVLWLLTAKPPLAITAAIALVAQRRWRPVVAAMGLAVLTSAVASPWLGTGWVGDYVGLLRHYDLVHLPPAFAWSIVPQSMSNLRAALSADLRLSDDVAVWISDAAWVGALAALLTVAWSRPLCGGPAWSLALLAYLLLCPHVSASEDIGLVFVPIALERRLPAPAALAALALVFGGLHLSPAMGVLARRRPSVLFFAKVALVGVVVAGDRWAAARAARGATDAEAPIQDATPAAG
jgi:hypothetical protein